jgi:hypothetical protein
MTHFSPVKFTQLSSPAMAVSANPPFQYAAAGTVVTMSKLPAGLKEWNLATKTNKREGVKQLRGQGMIGLDCGILELGRMG